MSGVTGSLRRWAAWAGRGIARRFARCSKRWVAGAKRLEAWSDAIEAKGKRGVDKGNADHGGHDAGYERHGD